jgi:hypothetical protein
MPVNRVALFLVLALVVTIASGCPQPEGPPTYPVSGEVTFDGKPVAEGQIIFEPAESDGTRPAAGPISEGKFRFEIEPGSKRVKVVAEREVGDVDPVMGARRRENYIPAKYNEKSELTAEVTTDEEQNIYSFPMQSN